MFGTGKKADKKSAEFSITPRDQAPELLVVAPEAMLRDRELLTGDALQLPVGQRSAVVSLLDPGIAAGVASPYVLSLFNHPLDLDPLADKVIAARAAGFETVLVVAINPTQLVALGQWLDKRAAAGRLQGMRLMIASDLDGVSRQLPGRLKPVTEDNVIRMPATTEVDNPTFKNFFVFSPELHALVARIRGFAANGISRACLLGGPGSGKTTLAYYYYLQRAKGKFVSVNLAAESVGDKAAIKSLLCGHVSGAFPGAGARTGAFQHARDGVCFLDESHEINGAVMEVLMEALDNGQYLPYGASAKQPLECAVLYATNRSWTHLMNSVNLDQFTRLGASTLQVPELSKREEDMIAVVATALAKMVGRCTNWVAPTGLSSEAWGVIRDCRWHGNIRGLVRVLESAFVDTATLKGGDNLIRATEIEAGIQLWEPKSHHSHQIYSVA
ncbi:MAG: sigma 54-interacting transcriptional regulator [Gammaproteobacteria bacterium]|nr:sigma 54-interacting transcriptional regulator [Gammaproteobacteria bacterium]